MEKEETEMQRFERLCAAASHSTVSINYIPMTPEKLFKFFKLVIKDCEDKQK